MKTIKKIKTGILLTGALTACALYGDEYLTIDYGEGPVARIKHDGKPIKCRVDDDDLEPRDFEYLFNGNILCAVVVKSDERFWVHIMDKTVSSSLKREMQKGADVIDFQSDRIAFLGKTRMANTFYAFGTKETTTAGISEDSKTELILRKKGEKDKIYDLNNPTERSKPEVRAAIQDMKKAMKELQKNQYFRWVDVNDTAIVLGLKRWNENLTAAENLKKEETAKLYTGVHHRRPIASNPSLPREVALATNSPGRLKQ